MSSSPNSSVSSVLVSKSILRSYTLRDFPWSSTDVQRTSKKFHDLVFESNVFKTPEVLEATMFQALFSTTESLKYFFQIEFSLQL